MNRFSETRTGIPLDIYARLQGVGLIDTNIECRSSDNTSVVASNATDVAWTTFHIDLFKFKVRTVNFFPEPVIGSSKCR